MENAIVYLQLEIYKPLHGRVQCRLAHELSAERGRCCLRESRQQEVASFLKPISPISADGNKRALPVAAAALGAVVHFGAGITMGPGRCGLNRIFGSCQSDKNAANKNSLFDVASSLSDSVQELNEETNDWFLYRQQGATQAARSSGTNAIYTECQLESNGNPNGYFQTGQAPHEKLRSDAVLQTTDQFQLRYGFFFAFIVLLEYNELPSCSFLLTE